jgi:hypothetical protein
MGRIHVPHIAVTVFDFGLPAAGQIDFSDPLDFVARANLHLYPLSIVVWRFEFRVKFAGTKRETLNYARSFYRFAVQNPAVRISAITRLAGRAESIGTGKARYQTLPGRELVHHPGKKAGRFISLRPDGSPGRFRGGGASDDRDACQQQQGA